MADDFRTKSLEVLAAAHQVSRERVSAGKSSWAYQLDIGQFLSRDRGNVTAEYLCPLAGEIGAYLKRKLPARLLDCGHDDFDSDLFDIVDHLDMTALYYAETPLAVPADDFNYVLRDLYDWADINRVWLTRDAHASASPEPVAEDRQVVPGPGR